MPRPSIFMSRWWSSIPDAESVNNLGSSLSHPRPLQRGGALLPRAMPTKPGYPDPTAICGVLQRLKSDLNGAEASLRQALKLNPKFIDARINLGLSPPFPGRLREARACFSKVSRPPLAISGRCMGWGKSRPSKVTSQRPKPHSGDPRDRSRGRRHLGALGGSRKMTLDDGDWFKGAQSLAASGIHPMDEAEPALCHGQVLRRHRGFRKGLRHYQRGNDLLKTTAAPGL